MRQKKPILVSVCMIAYQVAHYIEEAINGVLMQECDFEVELIISNDNSSDGTESVILEAIEKHPRGNWIKYFKHDKNLGMLPNYLWTFNKCQGKYISICDSDDYWVDPLKLQKQVSFLENNENYVLSFHDAFLVNGEGEKIQNSTGDEIKRDISFEDLTKVVFPIPTASVVFRNDLDLKFPKEYLEGTNHDTFLFVLLAQFGKFHFNEHVSPSAYRIHEKGTWNRRSRMEKSLHSVETFENICKVFPKETGFKIMLFEFKNHAFINALNEKKYKTFAKYYLSNFFESFTSKTLSVNFWSLHKKVILNKF